MKKAIISKPPEGGISKEVTEMLRNDGLYIGSNLGDTSRFVPILVKGGKVFSVRFDQELRPDRFIPGTQLDGPFNPTPPSN